MVYLFERAIGTTLKLFFDTYYYNIKYIIQIANLIYRHNIIAHSITYIFLDIPITKNIN